MNDHQNKNSADAATRKQNQDFPNIPASTDKIQKEDTLKKEIKTTSNLHPDGKTDNTDKSIDNPKE